MDQVNLSAWEGRTDMREGVIAPAQAAQIHATIGDPAQDAPEMGADMPPLWHWCAFPPVCPLEELASDGHPKLGGFLPPVPLGRRMWAGGTLRFGAPLRVGVPFTSRSVIARVTEKSGRTGRMVFVSVDHELRAEGAVVITERQDIVYLDLPTEFRPPAKQPMPEEALATWTQTVNEALLFRFSAITFNAHRIHYDLPYASEVEHYPGLVVHGPMQAAWLMRRATELRGRRPDSFAFRGVHPMLLIPGDRNEMTIAACAQEEAQGLTLHTGQAGHQCMQATATWEEST
ncbi:hypothetical protein FIU89_16610 [Roseovarius sp. THAF27]|nr:hypothetical protein FIU89_16610 [Roseovarius sp. THAF27]